MIKESDIKYAYGIKKLALSFKTSDLTSNYEEINDLLQFTETLIPNEIDIEERIFYEVALLLSQLRDYPLERITPETDLKDDLGMSKLSRSFLNEAFNSYIVFFGGNGRVSGRQCENCMTLNDCVELIMENL